MGRLQLARKFARSPTAAANAARNIERNPPRARSWMPVRAAAWNLLNPLIEPHMRVAVIGAGNGDTVPLDSIAARCAELHLIDVDQRAIKDARKRLPKDLRARTHLHVQDIVAGAADAAFRERKGTGPDLSSPLVKDRGQAPILQGAPFDVVVGDLFYTQLLYPALQDWGRSGELRDDVDAALTKLAVQAMEASARTVVHIHDVIAWWDGREQPFTLEEVLAVGAIDPHLGLTMARRGRGPHASDPLRAATHPPTQLALWRWPFVEGVDYLVCGSVTAGIV